MRRGQQGITLLGFILILAVLGCFAYVAMKIIPMYNEYYAVVKALKATVSDPVAAGADKNKLQDMISRHFEVSYIQSIQPKDIKVAHTPTGDVSLTADYEVRNQIGNTQLYLVAHFVDTESTGSAKAGAAAQ
jgi:Tfp pilus assembly major pilin PilA